MKKTIKRIVSVITAAAVLFSALYIIAVAVENEIVPDGYTPIYTAEEFNNIRNNLSGKYILMDDVDLSSYYYWESIGSSNNPFIGELDGNGHCIKNLNIYERKYETSTCYYGLFGYIKNSRIHDVVLFNCNIDAEYSDTKTVRCNVGIIASNAYMSEIYDCSVSGIIAISGNYLTIAVGGIVGRADILCSLERCSNYADIIIKPTTYSKYIYVGGVSGISNGNTKECCNFGRINVNSKEMISDCEIMAGGIDGNGCEASNLTDCYNSGNISLGFSTSKTYVGGVSGTSFITKNAYNSGNITLPDGFTGYAGSISGSIGLGGVSTPVVGTPSPCVENVYYSESDLSVGYSAGFAPDELDEDDFASVYKNFAELSDEKMKIQDSYAGFDFETVWETEENGYPVLKNQPEIHPSANSSGECGKEVNYVFNRITGDLRIYGNGDMDNYDSASMLEGFLCAPWFRERDYVKNVVIENGVTSIGSCAFDGCKNMTGIVIPGSIKKIGWSAFEGCKRLEGLELPDGLETIVSSAFMGCYGIKSISIPKTLTNLDLDCFYEIPYLESITVDSENPKYSNDEFGVLFNKDKTVLIRYPERCTAVDYTVPDSVVELETSSFASSWINSVVLPEGLKTIGWNAFEGCGKLKQIEIPDSVEKIGNYAFFYCVSLEKVAFPERITDIGSWAFYNCEALKSINIPEGARVIAEYAFNGCTALETVILPDGLTEIGANAFKDTAYFNNAESRDGYALYNGKYLLDVLPEAKGKFEIKDGTELIAGGAFSGRDELTEIIIPDSVKYIGNSAFSNCSGIKSIVIPKNVIKTGRAVFSDCDNLESVEILGSITVVDYLSFYYCKKLTRVVLPDTVKTIGESAFNNCVSLEEIQLPEGLEVIAKNAFNYSPKLTNVNFPESLAEIGDYAFSRTNISSVHISSNVANIGICAFNNTPNLSSVTVDENNPHFVYDGSALYSKDKSKLLCYPSGNKQSLYVIDSETKTIDRSAFSGNPYLEAITIHDGVENIGSSFADCTNLKSAAFGNGITQIFSHAFEKCTLLEKVYVPNSVVDIMFRSFYNCNNLKDIYYEGNAEDWSRISANSGLSSSITVHYNHVHSHTYSGYTESTEGQNGYELYTCECGHYYAVFDLVSKSDKYDVTASYSPDCFNEEVTLDVEEVTGNRDPGGIYMVDGKTYVQVGVFNLKAVNENGEVVQPNEGQTVKMKIAIPDGYKDKTDMVIYHRFVDGGREKLSTADGTLAVENGYMIFEISKFSEFEILAGTATVTVSKLPDKLTVNYRGTVDLSGIQLKITDIDGSVKYVTDTSKMTVENFDSTKLGVQTVTVRYEEYSCTFDIEVRYTWWQWILRILLLAFLWY